MEFQQISVADLAKSTNIPQISIYGYRKGKVQPSADRIITLAECLNVNALWLRGYNVPMQETLEQKKTDETIYIIANTMRDDFILHTATTDAELASVVYAHLKEKLRGTDFYEDLNILEFSYEKTKGLLNGYFRYSTDELRRSNSTKTYPNNLLQALEDINTEGENILPQHITEDIQLGLNYAISTLLDSEREVLRLRYQERKSFREIGQYWKSSSQYASKTERRALTKLLAPALIGYIQHGKQGFENLLAQEAKRIDTSKQELGISLIDLDLQARSLNALQRKGYVMVADIISLTKREISTIRNLGDQSIIEVAKKLEQLGLTDTAWSTFLTKEQQ